MPTLDPRYVPLPPLQQVLVNNAGGATSQSIGTQNLLLNNGVVTFYEDNSRTVLKPIYELSLSPSNEYIYTEVVNPLTLNTIGGYQDENGNQIIPYLFPYDGNATTSTGVVDLYYITVYDQSGNFQLEQSAWPAGVAGSSVTSNFDGANNLITNSQFVEVLFNNAATVYSLSGSNTITNIAPGWNAITSGTGSITVSQIAITATTAITNPPYALDIQSTGITQLILQQTISNSPRLVANGFISGTFVANSQDNTAHTITMSYVPSDGSSYEIINFSLAATAVFQQAAGTIALNETINPDPATTGYVNINIGIPVNSHIQLSSFQLIQVESTSSVPAYLEESTPSQISSLYWYDRSNLFGQPVESLLVGWDFTYNPLQFAAASTTVTSTPAYVWDQTIMASAGGNVTVTQDPITRGLIATTGSDNMAFYLLQYLSGSAVKKMLGTPLSVNVQAGTSFLSAGDQLQVYLFSAPSTASIPSLPTTIGTLASTGVFTLTASGWNPIPRGSQQQAIGTVQLINSDAQYNLATVDNGFSGWQITNATQISDTDYFAIVVTYVAGNSTTATTFQSISCVPGNIPTRPAPLGMDETLRKCQHYYETSYSSGALLGTATVLNAFTQTMQVSPNDGTTAERVLISRSFLLPFSFKRTTNSTITLYPVQGTITAGDMTAVFSNDGAQVTIQNFVYTTGWVLANQGNKSVTFKANSASGIATSSSFTGDQPEAFVEFQYTIDDRLGVV